MSRCLLAGGCLASSKAIGECGSVHHRAFRKEKNSSLPLQTSRVTVEVVLVSRNGTRVGVLPEGVVPPPIGQSSNGAGIASDPQWAVGSERGTVTGTSLPPIGGGVDYWVAALAGMVGVGEVLDPVDHRSSA